MPQIEMIGAVLAAGTLAGPLNGTWVLSGNAAGKGTLVSQVKLRAFEDAGGIVGEFFASDLEGVELPIDVSTLTHGRIPVWDENKKRWIPTTPEGVVGGGGGTDPDTTLPLNGNYVWINQAGATITDDGEAGLYLEVLVGGTTELNIRKKIAPALPYVITAHCRPLWNSSNAAGLCFRESGSGKLHVLSVGFSTHVLSSTTFGSPTNFFNGNYAQKALGDFNGVGALLGRDVWLRIADNGTNRICSYSFDGRHYYQLDSQLRTDFLTADEVGFCVFTTNAATGFAALQLMSWDEA